MNVCLCWGDWHTEKMPEIACHGIPTNYFTKPYTKNSAAQILPNKDSRKLNVYLVRPDDKTFKNTTY